MSLESFIEWFAEVKLTMNAGCLTINFGEDFGFST